MNDKPHLIPHGHIRGIDQRISDMLLCYVYMWLHWLTHYIFYTFGHIIAKS